MNSVDNWSKVSKGSSAYICHQILGSDVRFSGVYLIGEGVEISGGGSALTYEAHGVSAPLFERTSPAIALQRDPRPYF